MRKIGIFGGTFDPFTLAHREIVKQALAQKLVDYVYICPTIVSWHRENYKPWLNDDEKIKTIKALTSDSFFDCRISVWDKDLKIRQLCCRGRGDDELKERFVESRRFIDTLIDIKADLSNEVDAEFYPIIGSDEYEKFTSWYAYDSILRQSAGIIVVTDEIGRDRRKNLVVLNVGDYKKVKLLHIANRFTGVSASECREHYFSYNEEDYDRYIADMLGRLEKEKPKTLLKTPIFDVEKGPADETGLEPILVDAPDWVMIAVEYEGKYLVEKQYRYGSGSYVEEFPCGMVEPGEDPLDAAIRELKEETGIEIFDRRDVIPIATMNPNPAFMKNRMHLYYINLEKTNYVRGNQKLDDHERLIVKWEDKKEFTYDAVSQANTVNGRTVPAMLLSALAMLNLKHN